MASRWCRNVFNDWHFIWLRTRSSPKPNDNSCSDWDWDDELGVWQCDDSSSGYRGHYFYGGRYYQNKSTLKIHRRLNRINRLLNLKVELEAVQREDLGLKYVAIHKGSKRILFKISEFWSDLYECEYSLFHVFL